MVGKLTKGEYNLQVGDSARVSVVAMWAYILNLSSGLYLELDDCCYVLALSKKHCLCILLDQKSFSFNI